MPSALVSDDDDAGNGDRGMQGEHLPPEFDPQSSFFGSTYIKPERGQLISYIWANQPQLLYRVGLLVSDQACGRLRFYEGYKEPTLERATSRYNPQDIRFHLTKAAFQQGSFRIRNDLQIGACCYDWGEKRSYRLLNISFETGAVQVESLDGTTQCWISPDDLVGGYLISTGQDSQKRKRLHALIESNKSDSQNKRLQHFGSNTNSQESQQGDEPDTSTGSSIPRSLKLSSGILTYEHIIGILECSEAMNAEGWYARGRLYFDFKERILEIKHLRTRPNMLLLCGGFAPEVVAYKRLGAAPLGMVIIQDTDIAAVGVAVAAHPDVDFAIVGCPDGKVETGDVRILRDDRVVREIEIKVGGIDSTGISNPCQSFSLAGKKEGLMAENGKLFHDCVSVQRGLAESSDAPFYLAENVPSTIQTNEDYNAYLPDHGANSFFVCASTCSPSCRLRKFAANRPPPICPDTPTKGRPPCLNGDLSQYQAASIVSQGGTRLIHPKLKKVPCLMNSNPARNPVIWEQRQPNQEPQISRILPEEAERAMGYSNDEIGITAFTAEAAIRNRIALHDYERDGRLISLKGCASSNEFPLQQVNDDRRLALLGNSQAVTLLDAFLWPEKELYPPFDPTEDVL